ncbi:MAG: hypothetical protein ABIK07_07295 [Planctomycetota bacterium]
MNTNSLHGSYPSEKRVLLATGFALSCLIFTGCGGAQSTDGPVRYQLEGTVVYEGKPVPKGEITFRPDTSVGNQGPGGYVTIEQGKFKVAADKGVVGGAYIFTVTGFDGIPTPGSDVGEPSPNGKALFANIEIKQDLPKNDSKLELNVPAKKKK